MLLCIMCASFVLCVLLLYWVQEQSSSIYQLIYSSSALVDALHFRNLCIFILFDMISPYIPLVCKQSKTMYCGIVGPLVLQRVPF